MENEGTILVSTLYNLDTEVSLFDNAKAIRNPQIITIGTLLNDICSGRWEDIVTTARSKYAHSLRAYKSFKENSVPAVTLSVLCSGREGNKTFEEKFIRTSGLIQVDIDNIDLSMIDSVKNYLSNDKYCLMCFTSISGRGLKSFFRIGTDYENHLEYFKQIETYIFNEYGYNIDTSVKDLFRLCFIGYDPDIRINSLAEVFQLKQSEQKANIITDIPKEHSISKSKNINTDNDIDRIKQQKINVLVNKIRSSSDGNRHKTRLKMGELAGGFVAGGILSQNEAESILLSESDGIAEGGITSKKEIKAIKDALEDGKNKPIELANELDQRQQYLNSKRKTSKSKQVNAGVTAEGKATTKAKALIEGIHKYLAPFKIVNNVVKHTRQRLINNVMTDVSEDEVNSMYLDFISNNLDVGFDLFLKVFNSDFIPKYDPIENLLSSAPEYDPENEIDYIQKIADRVPVLENEKLFFEDCFLKWFVLYYGQCRNLTANPHVLILVSPQQGVGKSIFSSKLVPNGLHDYFKKSYIGGDMDKDKLAELSTNYLMELDELENLSKANISNLKSYISMTNIKVRLSYRRDAENLIRRCSFIGTSNKREMLSDDTGNRRFIPFTLQNDCMIELEGEFNILRAFKQAQYLVKEKGFSYFHFNMEEVKYLNSRNIDYAKVELLEELLVTHFRKPEENEDFEVLQTSEILMELNLQIDDKLQLTQINNNALGRALNKHFTKGQKYRPELKYQIKGWKVIQKTVRKINIKSTVTEHNWSVN